MVDKKQIILVVEGTAAMGPYWHTIVSDYLEKVIKSFIDSESLTPLQMQKPSGTIAELALVLFNAHGSYSSCLVQRSGWTRNVDYFFEWLSAIHFTGGGFCDAAIAEGLGEALMMFPPQNTSQNQHNLGVQRHCILVAASNPYSLPTPVYRPQIKIEPSDNSEAQLESRLSDAETIAKTFSQVNGDQEVFIVPVLQQREIFRHLDSTNRVYNKDLIVPHGIHSEHVKEKKKGIFSSMMKGSKPQHERETEPEASRESFEGRLAILLSGWLTDTCYISLKPQMRDTHATVALSITSRSFCVDRLMYYAQV